jgi:hypothetical protein
VDRNYLAIPYACVLRLAWDCLEVSWTLERTSKVALMILMSVKPTALLNNFH